MLQGEGEAGTERVEGVPGTAVTESTAVVVAAPKAVQPTHGTRSQIHDFSFFPQWLPS